MLESASHVRYEVTRNRVAAAVVVGAMLGAGELAGFHCALGAACDQRRIPYDLGLGFIFVALWIAAASPAWRALHRRSHSTALAAVSLGIASVLIPVFLYTACIYGLGIIFDSLYSRRLALPNGDFVLRALFWLGRGGRLAQGGVEWAVVGGSVGWAVWRTAYRTVTDKAPTLAA